MSVQAISWSLGKAATISAQAILMVLANHADEWGITYVGQDTVAGECACTRQCVNQNMSRLEATGLIGRVRRSDGQGRRSSDLVVLGPMAADRGGMNDADKRAASMYPQEVCDLARTCKPHHQCKRELRRPDQALCKPDQALRKRGLHEPSEEPSEEPSVTRNARAPVDDLPEDFPEAMLPHLRQVYKVLRALAERHGARQIVVAALANVVMARQHKPLVRSAFDYAAWADSATQKRKDVLSGYRNWVDRTDDLAGFEVLDDQGMPRTRATTSRRGGDEVTIGRSKDQRHRERWEALQRLEGIGS